MLEDSTKFVADDLLSVDTALPKKSPVSVLLRSFLKVITVIIIFFGILYGYLVSQNKYPETFPVKEPIMIEQGTEIRAITTILAKANVVKSEALLYYIIAFFHESTNIKASTYIFEEPISTWEVAKRLTEGDFDTDLIRFTHFEGERAIQIAEQAVTVLPNFNAETFIEASEPLEGQLFPDTYFLPSSYTATELMELLVATFKQKTVYLQPQIATHFLSFNEILVLASIIEREANSIESMRTVSGILQNRLELEMPLQADASVEYILDKPLSELTPEDLKVDSPYNTYLNLGLPPTPIGNPGLGAIKAVLEPIPSEYYYYITDNEGEFHYAETYNQHLVNIERYLR